MGTKDQINEICHHLLNGIEVIKSLCLQGRSGKLTPEDALEKIAHRAAGMEQGFSAIKDRNQMSPSFAKASEDRGEMPLDCLKTGTSNVQRSTSNVE